MSKKIISFTLLSINLLFSLTTLEAMRFKGLFNTPRALWARRLALPVLVVGGASYALAKESYCEGSEPKKIASSLFKPTILKDLTQEEKNELDLFKRFSIDFIGTPPDEIKKIIKHFEEWLHGALSSESEWKNTFLLYGIPGAGKNQVVSALGRTLQVPCYMLNSTRFIESYAGDSGKTVENFFTSIRANGEFAIVYLDEIDSVINAREIGQPSGEYTAARGTFLIEIEKLAGQHNIVLFAGLNDPKVLTPAIRSRFSEVKVNPIEKQSDIACFYEKKFQENSLFVLPEVICDLAKNTYGVMNSGWFSKYNFSTRDLREIADNATDLDELEIKPLFSVAFELKQLKLKHQKDLGLLVNQIKKGPVPLAACTDDLLKTMLKELSGSSSKEYQQEIEQIHGKDYTLYTTVDGKKVRIAKLSKEQVEKHENQEDNPFCQTIGNDFYHLSQCSHKDLSPAISSAAKKRKEEAANQYKQLKAILDGRCKQIESEWRPWVQTTIGAVERGQKIAQPIQSILSPIQSVLSIAVSIQALRAGKPASQPPTTTTTNTAVGKNIDSNS